MSVLEMSQTHDKLHAPDGKLCYVIAEPDDAHLHTSALVFQATLS